METKAKPRVIIKAEIIRADGTKENLGAVADSENGIGKVEIKGKVSENG